MNESTNATQVARDAQDQAAEVGRQAGTAASDVAGTVKEQAKQVKDVGSLHAHQLVGQFQEAARVQVKSRAAAAAGVVRNAADQLDEMGSSSQGPAGQVVTAASKRASELAGYLEGTEPEQVLEDVRRYARAHTGAFFAGSVLVGLLIGRALKAAKSASQAEKEAIDSRELGVAPVPVVSPLPAPEPWTGRGSAWEPVDPYGAPVSGGFRGAAEQGTLR